jgi:hypothetical protein
MGWVIAIVIILAILVGLGALTLAPLSRRPELGNIVAPNNSLLWGLLG